MHWFQHRPYYTVCVCLSSTPDTLLHSHNLYPSIAIFVSFFALHCYMLKQMIMIIMIMIMIMVVLLLSGESFNGIVIQTLKAADG